MGRRFKTSSTLYVRLAPKDLFSETACLPSTTNFNNLISGFRLASSYRRGIRDARKIIFLTPVKLKPIINFNRRTEVGRKSRGEGED